MKEGERGGVLKLARVSHKSCDDDDDDGTRVNCD